MKNSRWLWSVLWGGLLVSMSFAAMGDAAQQQKMLKQLDQLDQLDHMDFVAEEEKARACIRARDFDCAEKKIAKAAKYARNSQDKKSLRLAKERLTAEREQVANEEREAERQRIEEEERQQRLIAEERERREREAEEAETAQNWAMAGQILQQSMNNYSQNMAAQRAESASRTSLPIAEISVFCPDGSQAPSLAACTQRERDNANSRAAADAQLAQQSQYAKQQEAARQQQAQQQAQQRAQREEQIRRDEAAAQEKQRATSTGKRSYPGLPKVRNDIWDSSRLNENVVKTWCEKYTRMIRESFVNSENELISMGNCTCKDVSITKMLRPEYACEFPYVWKQNVPGNEK